MTGAGGKRFRTRTGEQVKLVDLIDEAVERAEEVITDRYDDPELRRQIAEAVGIGALKYGDLSVARDSGYVLDFDRLLALTGNTGPYLQYATARIRSIFRRAGLEPETRDRPDPARPRPPSGRWPCGCSASARRSTTWPTAAEPHKLAAFLFEVASAFTTFYEQCPVLQAAEESVRPQQARAVRADPARPADRPGPARHPGARAHVAAARPFWAYFRGVPRMLPGSAGCRPSPLRQARGHGHHASAARRRSAGLLDDPGARARDRTARTGAGLEPAARAPGYGRP